MSFLPKSPLYRGLFRLFVVLDIVWAFALWWFFAKEDLKTRWPGKEVVDRVETWAADLYPLYQGKGLDSVPYRKGKIEAILANGEVPPSLSGFPVTQRELSGYRHAITNGIEGSRMEGLRYAMEPFFVSAPFPLYSGDTSLTVSDLSYCRHKTPWWDFRGVRDTSAERLSATVSVAVSELDRVHETVPSLPFGITRRQETDEAMGLLLPSDRKLASDVYADNKSRVWRKPVFWICVFLSSSAAAWTTILGVVSLVRWIITGFTSAKPQGVGQP
jgi:hypothetical protein